MKTDREVRTLQRIDAMIAEAKKFREAHKYDVKQQYYDGEIAAFQAVKTLITQSK
jgi:hypothetical protein